MLYEVFNNLREAHGPDYFTSRVSTEVVQNLNLRFDLREYQKEAKEGWKQKFLLETENKADTDLKFKNKHFKLKRVERFPCYKTKILTLFSL